MSPTTDDLRALLAQRTEERVATDPTTVARLVGVRARIQRRRRVRAAAGAAALALLVGAAGLTTSLAGGHRAQGPAQSDELPLAASTSGETGSRSITLARGTELRIVARCGPKQAHRASALLNGREAVAVPCDGRDHARSISTDSAWALSADRPVTVTLFEPGNPTSRLPLQLRVYSRAEAVQRPLPQAVPEPGTAGPDANDAPLLGGLVVPVTADVGTKTFTVIPGGWDLSINDTCWTSPDGPAYWAVISVNGHDLASGDCSSADPAINSEHTPEDQDQQAYWKALGVRPGSPMTVSVRLARNDHQNPPDGAPELVRTVPGAFVTVSLTGQPDLDESGALYLVPDVLAPPLAAAGVRLPRAATLSGSTGDITGVDLAGTTSELGLVVACRGYVDVTFVVLIDGKPALGDIDGSRSRCEPADGSAIRQQLLRGKHRIELRIEGGETDLVVLGIYAEGLTAAD